MLISIIVPIYNEEEALPLFFEEIFKHLQAYNFELLFINDGSKDGSKKFIKEKILQSEQKIKLLSFSRNFGKEAALFAGLEAAKGDCVIPIDVDLQDPIELIPEMLKLYKDGADVVLAKRSDRKSDNFLKRFTASLFYKLHNKISSPKIEENVGDFRLLSRRVVEAIKLLPEKKLFMKGIFSWVGFERKIIEYKRQERSAGKSKFSAWKLWNFALEGITSFSTFPLRIWTYLGFFIAAFSFLLASKIIIEKLFFGNAIHGYPSLIVSILFIGGIQLIGIGILGEYLGRVYEEVKNRPRYILEESYEKKEENE